EGQGTNAIKRSQTMDDAAAKYVGAWKTYSLTGAYNNNFRYLPSTGGSSTATYEFTGLAPGSYRVMATWYPPLANRSNDVPFVITSGASTTTVKVNQRNAPAENAKIDGSIFQALATIGVSGGTLTVTIHEGSNTSGYAIADAVRIELATKGPRAPAPSAEEQAAATKRVRQLFAEKIASARANRAERLKLSEQLLALAEQTDDDTSGRFALYQEAADQALAAGAVEAYTRAMEALGQQYVVDTTEQLQHGLLELAKSAHGADAGAEVTRALLEAIDTAILAEKWENAQAMSRAASTLAAKSGDSDLRKRVLQQGREMAGMKALAKDTERAKAKLEQEPDDPESNRAVGIHQALILGEWDKALPLLAKGDDASLSAAAKAELAAASEKGDWAEAADKWWTVTKGDSGSANLKKLYSTKSTAKECLRRHVAEVQAKALPKATGLNKRLIEQRLEELQPAEAPAAKKAAAGLAETLARKKWIVTWSDGAVYRNVTFKSDGTWSAVAAPRIPLAGRWKTDGDVVVATYGNYVDRFRSAASGILAESQSGANRQGHRTGQVRAE
ncbi:MAG: hypothetical protein K8T91_08885, partial [Planctomycetes bacterium]|nr:hypothetical protein [Planctomycetota bacterium]